MSNEAGELSRALLVTDLFPPKVGGSCRWYWEVYRRLPRGRAVIVAGEAAGQESFDRGHNLDVVRMPLTLPSWGIGHPAGLRAYWSAARRLRRLAEAEGISILHCGRCLPEGLMALIVRRLAGLPYLCFAHGEEIEYAASSRELAWLTRRVVNGARLIVANSANTRRILVEGWGVPEDRVRVIHPGVDTSRFVPADRDPEIRRALGWGDRTVILTVGRLQKRKGHDQMIRALDAIRRTFGEVLYAIVGEGEERKILEAQVAGSGLGAHVQFLGEPDDAVLVRCFQQCDLFALPNRRVGRDIEGFGMVLVEAQACGKPVLAGASGGTAETMEVSQTGLVVPCEGPEALAEAVVDLLSDPGRLASMGLAARRRAVERFDWDALVRQAEGIFREAQSSPKATGALVGARR